MILPIFERAEKRAVSAVGTGVTEQVTILSLLQAMKLYERSFHDGMKLAFVETSTSIHLL